MGIQPRNYRYRPLVFKIQFIEYVNYREQRQVEARLRDYHFLMWSTARHGAVKSVVWGLELLCVVARRCYQSV